MHVTVVIGKGWDFDKHNIDESERDDAERKKPASKGHIPWDPIYINFMNRQNCGDRKQIRK